MVPLLNGLEHLESRRDRYGDGHVVAATIRVESTRAAAGRIEHTRPFADNRCDDPAVDGG
ncbi:2-dehydropantoate 2-reductase N-terminal domain-containing protein [Streptomyces sioyaensis]|uniref:2-dehydropantoate 2-reductase N-terminal domain-containing protein n=1 Tax=Streptomyces sioyaensis TaxID=67364 RepID=UPI0027E466FB|nr:2-dehydropantoate 2-reductase N-terminal domain-containing protein [Streptomyces sioyaensis]